MLVLAILLIANFSAISQTTPRGNRTAKTGETPVKENFKPTQTNGPEIEFNKMVHDYGTIIEGANGECEFEFKNVGSEPLVLSNVSSSCGCTVPNWPKDPVMPGKTAVIKVKYNTNRTGAISKTVTVYSNAVENSKVTLRIAGQVKPKQEEALPEKQQSPMQQNTN